MLLEFSISAESMTSLHGRSHITCEFIRELNNRLIKWPSRQKLGRASGAISDIAAGALRNQTV